MGYTVEILKKISDTKLVMKENYLRPLDFVVDEKGVRYAVLECEEKEEEVIINNNQATAESLGMTIRHHIPNTSRKVMRGIITLNKPLENGMTLEHRFSAFTEEKEIITDKEVLQKAIVKAIENGWTQLLNQIFEVIPRSNGIIQVWVDGSLPYSSEEVIFSHDFAKAFWGEKTEYIELAGRLCDDVPIWQYELQKMVLEKNPIDYLRKFI